MNKTIFFLDNNPNFRERLQNLLSEKYEVVSAGGPKEGLSVFQQHKQKIDLLLLDIMMPTEGMFNIETADGGILTGLLFYKKVCKEMYTKQEKVPPVIFLTGLEKQIDDLRDKHCIHKKDLDPNFSKLFELIRYNLKKLKDN